MRKVEFFFEELFKNLNIKREDNIVVHSNLFIFGFSSPKLPKIIIQKLKSAVGSCGTIVMPLYTFGTDSSQLYDKKKLHKSNHTSLLSKIFYATSLTF